MLMINEFVKPYDRYRRDLLRDQYQSESKGRVGKVVAVIVVAGALILAACGTPADINPGADGPGDVNVVWAPEQKTLEEEFSGVAAPDWHPAYGHLAQTPQTQRQSGPR